MIFHLSERFLLDELHLKEVHLGGRGHFEVEAQLNEKILLHRPFRKVHDTPTDIYVCMYCILIIIYHVHTSRHREMYIVHTFINPLQPPPPPTPSPKRQPCPRTYCTELQPLIYCHSSSLFLPSLQSTGMNLNEDENWGMCI